MEKNWKETFVETKNIQHVYLYLLFWLIMINIISFIIISFIVNFKIMRNLNLSPSCIVYQHHHHHMYNINISQLTIWHHPLCGCFVNVFYFSIRTNLSPGRTVVMIWYGMEAIQTQKPYNIHISLEWWKIACSYHLTMMIMIINMIWKTGWCWIWKYVQT